MVCLGECVQEAHVSCKAEADSYQATVRSGLAGCLDPRGMVATGHPLFGAAKLPVASMHPFKVTDPRNHT
jgi:hypothetical protein